MHKLSATTTPLLLQGCCYKPFLNQRIMWVITFAVNEYNQEGDYFDRVFNHKPTKEELDKLGYDSEHLLKGGGRKDYEYKWYYLTEIKSGEQYDHS